jgi:hypothetical protein
MIPVLFHERLKGIIKEDPRPALSPSRGRRPEICLLSLRCPYTHPETRLVCMRVSIQMFHSNKHITLPLHPSVVRVMIRK